MFRSVFLVLYVLVLFASFSSTANATEIYRGTITAPAETVLNWYSGGDTVFWRGSVSLDVDEVDREKWNDKPYYVVKTSTPERAVFPDGSFIELRQVMVWVMGIWPEQEPSAENVSRMGGVYVDIYSYYSSLRSNEGPAELERVVIGGGGPGGCPEGSLNNQVARLREILGRQISPSERLEQVIGYLTSFQIDIQRFGGGWSREITTRSPSQLDDYELRMLDITEVRLVGPK